MKKIICMGVAGCGKSSVGKAVSEHFGWIFVEGDDLHGTANIEKMSRGEALTDDDRWPWLLRVGEQFGSIADNTSGLVVSCSALRRSYRDRINEGAGGEVFFLHLHSEQSVISKRMAARKNHFMPPGLLNSQYQTLELFAADEYGAVIDISGSMETSIANSIATIQNKVMGTS